MTQEVKLYDAHYSQLTADAQVAVRRRTYDEDLGQSSWLTAAQALEFFRLLELGPGQRALEVACGSGGVTCRMARETGAVCVGVDINPHGIEAAQARAREQKLPFITKHNQGGKGLGVRRFDDLESFDAYVDGPDFEVPVDGITLLQEFLEAEEPFSTRVEFVGGRFVYAVRVDTSAGSFELCPADACVVPAGADPASWAPFAVRGSVTAEHPLVQRLEAFLAAEGIEVAGVEFIETADGRTVPYDVNTNSNYNPDVERSSSVSAAATLAAWLGEVLAAEYAVTPA